MAKKITPQAVDRLACWPVIGRIVLKAALLFVLLNVAFALLDPMSFVGRIGIYNWLVPGRERITYNHGSTRSHTVTTANMAANLGTHVVAGPHPPDEFRVFVFGDSATWAVSQSHDQTVTAFLNDMNLTAADGRPMRFYNLGYPESSASKTLLLLDAAMRYQPDMIVWNLTLQAFYPYTVYHFLVTENPIPMARLDAAYDLPSYDPDSPQVVHPSLWDRTLVRRREELATLLRLQVYGIPWGLTGVDNIVYPYEAPPDNIPVGREDPGPVSPDDLTFEYLYAIFERAEGVPVVLVNEPIFIASGENSDRWYNESYSRQQFDSFRKIMAEMAMREGWTYLDAWDVIPPPYFTRDEMHRNPEGEIRFATYLAPYFVEWASQ